MIKIPNPRQFWTLARQKVLYEQWKGGTSMAKLGVKYGVSDTRIKQVLREYRRVLEWNERRKA